MLRIDPKSIDALLGKAQLLLAANRLEDADRNIERAFDVDSSRPDLWLLKAQLSQMQGNLYEARLLADHGVALSLDSAASWLFAAEILQADNQNALADRYLAVANQLDPSLVEVSPDFSGESLTNITAESKELDDFISERPNYGHAYHDRACIYEALEESHRSLHYLDAAIEINPDEEKEMRICERGVLLLNLGRPEEAHGCFVEVLKFNPENVPAKQGLAIAEERLSAVAESPSESEEESRPIPATTPKKEADFAPSGTQAHRTCPQCGNGISFDARFCSKCGVLLDGSEHSPQAAAEAPARCTKCGARLRQGVRFCTGCGVSLAPVPPHSQTK
jgi:tetratricopeptide (TPR) repeat protein